MSWFETSLTHLEARLRELFEGSTDGNGISKKFLRQLEHELSRAIKPGPPGLTRGIDPNESAPSVPDKFTLLLPALQAQLLLTHPTELDRLTRKLESMAAQYRVVFRTAPLLRVVADPQSIGLKVLADYSKTGMGDSYTTEVDGMLNGSGQASVELMPKAFLIVNGLTTFPLAESVINIGRDPSNQLLLEDMRVSRIHAQLRLHQGRFVIFDLDSKSGTFVNGVAVTSHALHPGDVILLGGVPLVYGQEAAIREGYTQELPVDPPTPEEL